LNPDARHRLAERPEDGLVWEGHRSSTSDRGGRRLRMGALLPGRRWSFADFRVSIENMADIKKYLRSDSWFRSQLWERHGDLGIALREPFRTLNPW
jgi:hypothetical protein